MVVVAAAEAARPTRPVTATLRETKYYPPSEKASSGISIYCVSKAVKPAIIANKIAQMVKAQRTRVIVPTSSISRYRAHTVAQEKQKNLFLIYFFFFCPSQLYFCFLLKPGETRQSLRVSRNVSRNVPKFFVDRASLSTLGP